MYILGIYGTRPMTVQYHCNTLSIPYSTIPCRLYHYSTGTHRCFLLDSCECDVVYDCRRLMRSRLLGAALACCTLVLFWDSGRKALPCSEPRCIDDMLDRLKHRLDIEGLESDGIDQIRAVRRADSGRRPDIRLSVDRIVNQRHEARSDRPRTVRPFEVSSLSQLHTSAPQSPPLPPPPPPPPPTASSLPQLLAECSSGTDVAMQESIAHQTYEQVGRWQRDGEVCSGVGQSCRLLPEVVPAGGRAHNNASATPTPMPTCADSGGRCATRSPRVFVYTCMDAAHERLLREAQVSAFFDANLARNQYLSEYALHRSLLLSSHRVHDPEAADVFFVPFYARLAYADRQASGRTRQLQRDLTHTLDECLGASAAWRRSGGRDHMVALSSTRDPRKLFGEAWSRLKRALHLRIEAADDVRYHRRLRGPAGVARRRPVVLPYYVPHFAEDEEVTAAGKKHSVCFFGTATNPVRRRALLALRRVPGAMLQLGSAGFFNKSEDAQRDERRRTLDSRRALRHCKLCLVPAGITPSRCASTDACAEAVCRLPCSCQRLCTRTCTGHTCACALPAASPWGAGAVLHGRVSVHAC